MQENSEANKQVESTTLLRALSQDYQGDPTATAEPAYEMRRFDSMPEQPYRDDNMHLPATQIIDTNLTENVH